MLAVSHPSSSSARALHPSVMDGESGTIDPAALNASSASTITPTLSSHPSARGVKRSRSPDAHHSQERDAELHANKRSRSLRQGESPAMQQTPLAPPVQAVHTPHIRTQSLPHASPSQSSPQRSTPGSAKAPVVKALPTVRDHTTDQLGPDGDEYLPRESDQDGELKVSNDGYPQGGRKYKCRTFKVPNRGEKLFMLATECARVLGYRDSYLLFNKNRSLYKIIASQQEKDNLIHQEILPYSYRSRQIAIVTARSMFRQFGSRLIEGGRRVRDDYWEAKARKQGFTEEDAAGEKRPGAAKAREAAAAEAAQNTLTIPQGEIIYSNGPGYEGPPGIQPVPLAPLPMIHMPQDLRSKDYSIMRPRQEPAGPAWQDRSHPSSQQDIFSQAQSAADFNKALGQQRDHREKYLQEYWKRPHEQPVTEPQTDGSIANAKLPQNLQSPQIGLPQLRHDQGHGPANNSQMINQSYNHSNNNNNSNSNSNNSNNSFPHQQNPSQSPLQQPHPRAIPQPQLSQASPGPVNMSASHRQTPSFNYGQHNQLWGAPQPQQPPQTPMYGGQPHHQSPMPPPPPQLQQQGGMGYGQMPPYSGMNRAMYQPSPSPQHFNMGGNQQAPVQGWNTPGSAGSMPPDWSQRFQ